MIPCVLVMDGPTLLAWRVNHMEEVWGVEYSVDMRFRACGGNPPNGSLSSVL